MKLEDIFNKVDICIIVWENDKCIYTNKPNDILDTSITDYLINNENLRGLYTKLFDTKLEQSILINNNKIKVEYLNDDIYCETNYHNTHPHDHNTLLAISHKLRDPLTNIIGVLSLINNNKKLNKKYLKIVKSSSYEIVSLANDLVDIINLSQHNVKLKMKPTDFKEFIKDVISIVKYDNKKINVVYDIDEKVPAIINTDPQRLKQVIVNLLQNSINNTNIGSVILSIENKIINDKLSLYFEVKDTGCGIDEEKQKYIDNFLNSENIEINSYNIYGFGILLSSYIIKLMGGEINYNTKINTGTTFYFSINI